MDACLNVEREIEEIIREFGSFNVEVKMTLTNLIGELEEVKDELECLDKNRPLTAADKFILLKRAKRVKAVTRSMANEHKELHKALSKVGKAIDKNFIQDYAINGNEDVIQTPENTQILNKVICEHFLSEGMLEIADEFIKETGLQMEQDKSELFTELNRILQALKKKDLHPAIVWASENRQKLKEQNSSLEFQLHRLNFIDLMQQGVMQPKEAICYAQDNFQHMALQHEKDIQQLMGCLLYSGKGIQNSPYSYLLDPGQWDKIYDMFTRDAYAVLGLPVESPLTVCTNAGCSALPALLDIKQGMQQTKVGDVWNKYDELPVEIDLGSQRHFHSVFVCPILKQQTSEENPPMKLVCGHVISRDALNQLANNNKLKCPYCSVEQNVSDARLIHF